MTVPTPPPGDGGARTSPSPPRSSGLVEEFWLLTTGATRPTRPTGGALLGVALAFLVELERAGEARWTGLDGDAVFDAVGDCRCGPPRRAWHDALLHPVLGPPTPARFVLDPLVPRVWDDTAAHLVRTGHVTMERHRFGRPAHVLTDPDAVRARREEIVAMLSANGGVSDLPQRELDLLVVAAASDAEGDLLMDGLDLPDRLQDAVTRSVAGSVTRRRLGPTLAYRGAHLLG